MKAGKKNGVNLALDAAGLLLVGASLKFQIAGAIGGSVLGAIGIGTSIAGEDYTGAGIAYGGKLSAMAGGVATAGSRMARGALKFGAASVVISMAKNADKAMEDFQKCMSGKG